MFLWVAIYLFTIIIKEGLCACWRQEAYFSPYLLLYFVAAAAPVYYKHSFFYSHYILPMTFLRPLDVELTVEIYQELIS